MKTILIFVFLINSIFSIAQCNYNFLLSSKMGSSLYDTYNSLQLNKFTIQVTKDSYKYWEKLDYLNGDSVFRSQINLELRNPCDCGNETIDAHYLFADDMLYRIEITIHIPKNQYLQGFALYKKFIEDVKLENYYKYNWTGSIKNKDEKTRSEEKIGEFVSFCTSEMEAYSCKYSSVEISFKQEYSWSQYTHTHGDISEYIIQLSKVNLKFTKLTCKGF